METKSPSCNATSMRVDDHGRAVSQSCYEPPCECRAG